MSTRAIIAKPEGDGWVGTYHHYDGYPTGLGTTLLEAHAGYFAGDVDAMTRYLIDDELVGWSDINGADWSQAKGWHDHHDPNGTCAECGRELWRHYAQYYPEGGPADPMVNGCRRRGLVKPDEVVQLGHGYSAVDPGPLGPQSYTARGETPDNPDGDYFRSTDEHVSGAEWVYVLLATGVMVIEHRGYGFVPVSIVPWGDVAGMAAAELAGAVA